MRIALLLLLIPVMLAAGSSTKSIMAVRTAVPPVIDGRIDEPDWQRAPVAGGFLQLVPVEGAPASEPTEVRFLYDDDALYVACIMRDAEPLGIVARLARRDDEVEADGVSLRIDTFHDHQTNVEFSVSAAGVKTDIQQYDDGRSEDASWDVVWDVRTRITPEGWTAEFRIPFRALRFSPAAEQDWGLQILRQISRKKESDYWVLIPKSESGWTSRFGHLVGLRNIPAPSGVEVLPYVLGTERMVPVSPEYPTGKQLTGNAGVDLTYHPSTDLTINAAFNPDFGQVEADPEVLNLSTFETFYPEKRPFFVEGSQIFQFNTFGGGSGLFYSRRIGRPLEADAPDSGAILSQPHFATILGAAKVSGKTTGGLSFGVLESVTGREDARLMDAQGRAYNQDVEPLSNYALVRVRQDVLDGSNVGMILTGVHRDGRLPAYTGGLDWNLKTADASYRLDGFWAASHAMPNGVPRDGSAGKIGLWKDGGEHWRGGVSVDYTSPGFYINDVGYFRRPNDFGSSLEVQYREDRPAEWYRSWHVQASHNSRRNFDGADLGNGIGVEGEMEFANYWVLEARMKYDGGLYDDRESRGFGWYRKPATRGLTLEVHSDSRNSVVGEAETSFSDDTRGATELDLRAAVEVKVLTNLTFSVQAERAQRRREFAWMTNALDTTVTAGEVSVFGDRSAGYWDLTSRGSWVFTRDLTLQWYVQLFIAEQRYEHTARIVSPAAFVPYAIAAPDAHDVFLNSNLVLRWEYLPGSTLYLVWSQSRAGRTQAYGRPLGKSVADVFDIGADNVVMLKMSYWLSY